MATVFIRTVIIYFLFMTSVRLMGKRQVGELQLSELITTFMLSELAVNPIQDTSIPILYSLIPMFFLLAAEVATSFLMTKSSFLKKIFSGNPSVIIKKGNLDQKELSKLRMGINELMGELRLKNISDISDVDYAILEQNGKLSVFPKSKKQSVCAEDIKINKEESGIAHAVIIDGEIDESNLKTAGKSVAWIENYLKKHRINMKTVFLMTIDDKSSVNVIVKEEK